MTPAKLPHHRLQSQRIAATSFEDPAGPVRWLAAVQAQDYLGSLGAIGLRTRNAAEKIIERAIADRAIVRAWPMRGTLHFVAAEDVRWMLQLMTPRDEKAFGRSGEIIARALSAGDRGERAHGGKLDQGARERLCHVRLESVHPSRHDCAPRGDGGRAPLRGVPGAECRCLLS
jgi:hypothetical protein